MRVNAQDIRKFLGSGSIYNSITREKREKYMELYEQATKTTSHITGMPSGGGADRNAVLANLADADGSTEKWWGFLTERRELIRSFIEECPLSDFYRDILINRYIFNLGWEPMAYSLRKYDKPGPAILRSSLEKALKDCADWVNLTGKYKKEILDI